MTDLKQVSRALQLISNWLTSDGKFVFEVETLKAAGIQQGVWKGSWVTKPDGSQIVLNTLSRLDAASGIETTLCRYELWERNTITLVEVENFRLKLYESSEIEHLLHQYGFKVIGRRQAEPYKKEEADVDVSVIMYECKKANHE